jgi:hypothetical protein
MITRQHLTHLLEPNMTKTTDKPAAWRRAAALFSNALIRIIWLWAWLMVVSGSIVIVGIACRLLSGSFHFGWTLFGHY